MLREEQQQTIEGPSGQLELSVNHEPTNKHCVIICHPHPLHGGTMNNKVVTTLAKGYQLAGVTTIRFNYRGVGASEGEYGDGYGESEDLVAIIAWAKQHFSHQHLHLAGFSFGTFVVLHTLQQEEIFEQIGSVILVAPPVHHFKYDFKVFPKTWLIFQCDDDEVVPSTQVYQWVERLYEPKPELIRFQQAGHFFHGRLIELRAHQVDWLNKHVITT